MNDAKDLIQDSLELVSLPAVVMQAMELLNNPSTSAADIGDAIIQDPALTARLLKVVNSSFYGFPSKIETVSRAITIVGTLELTDLILGTSAVHTFQKIPNQLVDMQQFWEHSLYAAVVARIIAKQLCAPNSERCFVMGLLHDIGSLILYRLKPEQSRQALEMAAEKQLPLVLAEKQVFGFDHADVGAELMTAWNLPESFSQVVLHHHEPSSAASYRLEGATIHLADVISGMKHVTGSNTGRVAPLEPLAWEMIGLPADSVDALASEADIQFSEASSVILPARQAA